MVLELSAVLGGLGSIFCGGDVGWSPGSVRWLLVVQCALPGVGDGWGETRSCCPSVLRGLAGRSLLGFLRRSVGWGLGFGSGAAGVVEVEDWD